MASNALTNLSLDQLRRVVSIKEQIAALEAQLTNVLNGFSRGRGGRASRRARPGKSAASSAARPAQRPKRKVSAAARAKLRAIAKARWAKVKAAGKSAL